MSAYTNTLPKLISVQLLTNALNNITHVYIYIYLHTHTHIYIYIYIYIYIRWIQNLSNRHFFTDCQDPFGFHFRKIFSENKPFSENIFRK